MPKNVISLDTIDDDTLILIFGFLTVPDILATRQVRSLYKQCCCLLIQQLKYIYMADIQTNGRSLGPPHRLAQYLHI